MHPVYHGTESLSFLGPKISDLVPVEVKQSETLYSFKLKIKNRVPIECPCVKKIKKLVKEIEENDGSTDIVISGLIKRFDRNAIDDIERINEKLKRWCIGKGLTFIDNNNIYESCLNQGKLHLNRRGSSYLANNFKKFIESL